jgi:hypothetical protein
MAVREPARRERPAPARIARTGHRHRRRRRAERPLPASTAPARSTVGRCNARSPFCFRADVICLSTSPLRFSTVVHGSSKLELDCQRRASKLDGSTRSVCLRRRPSGSWRTSKRASAHSQNVRAPALRGRVFCNRVFLGLVCWTRREETSWERTNRREPSEAAIFGRSEPRQHRWAALATPGSEAAGGPPCAAPSKSGSDRLRRPGH